LSVTANERNSELYADNLLNARLGPGLAIMNGSWPK
jgi:hypothetical protein